jgi:hypothetical protein
MNAADKQAHVAGVRDLAVAAVKESGVWERWGPINLLTARRGDLQIGYRTPFQQLPKMSHAESYGRALLGGRETLPYGLDIWHRRIKVLNLEWNDRGDFEVISYMPGEWEWQLRPGQATSSRA